MEGNIDDVCRLFRLLSINMNRRDTLREILNLVGSIRKETLHCEEVEGQLPRLFDCLNTSDKEELELACSILKKILPDMDPEVVFTRCFLCLQRTVSHPVEEVRVITMSILLRAAEIEHLVAFIFEGNLLPNSILCLFTNDLNLTKLTLEFIKKLCKDSRALKIVLSGNNLHYLKTYRAASSEFAFRVYEVIVEIAMTSEECFMETVNCGLLPELITEIKREDALSQLNALDLMGKLAVADYVFKYLETEGVILYIFTKFVKMSSDRSQSLLLPGYIKFYGELAKAHPIEVAAHHPVIIEFIIRAIVRGETDAVALTVSLETIALIASSSEGKRVLYFLGDAMPRLMANFKEHVTFLPAELKVRAMNAYAAILHLKPEQQTEDLMQATSRWFAGISESPMEAVLTYCYQPFPDIQSAALSIIQVLAEQPWGVKQINKHVGLMEFLLDRERASSKVCKEIKFEIIRSLLRSPIAESEFTANILVQMGEYVRQGPFFAEGNLEVAVEERAN